ncbi:protein O-mannosyl-transferase 2-like [Penaeus monodon]|uniref:protein O-mannosyl-transferase 2-like n=1 Tax=Penaeus monodon TaxID=6687 RepID=UPI0018A79F30|nr:protein O-mannosyl-transferase 2-like [Penaeus monodon]
MALTIKEEISDDSAVSSEGEKGILKVKKRKNKKKRATSQENHHWWYALAVVTLLAVATRQIGLDQPAGTVWDEVHFGTFANHYINRTFYHDVHPPLGKMMVAGAAWLTGYQATFEFAVGKEYTPDINFVGIRGMMALLGATLVPLTFLVVWEASFSLNASVIASVCVLCDTFIHRLNTLLLLDPPLLVAIVACVYGTIKFHNQRHREWSLAWWSWLMFTGVCLGAVTSIKYVGVFTVLYVGVHTAYQLLCILVDSSRPVWHVFPHTAARVLGLIILPIAVYLSTFVIHFWVLTDWSVNGGGFYPTKFFAAFSNTEYDNATFPEHIHYGANITIQSSRPICGYLESWFDLFPSDYTAPCQQVTTSTIRDDEGLMWIIKKVDLEAGAVIDGGDPKEAPVIVKNGDFIMLTHAETGRSLRSHGHRAPITKRHFQVCGYGDDGAGGPFETWELVIPGEAKGANLTIINQDFMLRHWKMNCYLKGNEMVKLPKEWAFSGAKEVTCSKNPTQPGTLWHINWNNSPKLAKTVHARDRSVSLWEKIYQQHLNMFVGNAVLTPPDDMERQSRPWMWPILWQMQTMASYMVNNATKEEVYAIGMTNPLVTYLNLACLMGLLGLAFLHSYRGRRWKGHSDLGEESRADVLSSSWWLVLCWAFHYLPFFFMSRVLYYHHYCPSYIFSCMITGMFISWACETVSSWSSETRRQAILLGLLTAVVALLFTSYAIFFPLATYLTGTVFEASPRINPYLDYFYVGQMWPEFGYRKAEFMSVTTTKVELWKEDILDNPHLNATLYYSTPLNTSAGMPALNPVRASNYTLWTSTESSLVDVPYLSTKDGDGIKSLESMLRGKILLDGETEAISEANVGSTTMSEAEAGVKKGDGEG